MKIGAIQLEALLEEAHIKVSSLVSDLLGISARRMLQALADGETDKRPSVAVALNQRSGWGSYDAGETDLTVRAEKQSDWRRCES